MAMNGSGRGQMRVHSTRSPPFLVIGLSVVIFILAFNYWSLSSRNNETMSQLTDLQEKYRIVALRKISVEKRNDALIDRIRETEDAIDKSKLENHNFEQDINSLRLEIHNKEDDFRQKRLEFESKFDQCLERENNCTLSAKVNTENMNDHFKQLQEDCKASVEDLRKEAAEYKSKIVDCGPLLMKERITILYIVEAVLGQKAGDYLKRQPLDAIRTDENGKILNPEILVLPPQEEIQPPQGQDQVQLNVQDQNQPQQDQVATQTVSTGQEPSQNQEEPHDQSQGPTKGSLNADTKTEPQGTNMGQPKQNSTEGGQQSTTAREDRENGQSQEGDVPPLRPNWVTSQDQTKGDLKTSSTSAQNHGDATPSNSTGALPTEKNEMKVNGQSPPKEPDGEAQDDDEVDYDDYEDKDKNDKQSPLKFENGGAEDGNADDDDAMFEQDGDNDNDRFM